MKLTWAESQLIYARRLRVLRALKPAAYQVYDALLTLATGPDGATLTIEQIAAAASLQRRAVQLAAGELEHAGLVSRFTAGDGAGLVYMIEDQRPRWETIDALRRGSSGGGRTRLRPTGNSEKP